MRPLAILLSFSPVLVAADPPKFTTPEPDFIADDLREAGPEDKAHPLPQDLAAAKRLRDDRLKFYRDQYVVPFEKSTGAAAAWADKAKAALNATAEHAAIAVVRLRQHEAIARRDAALKAAVAAGCDDPVVQTLHTLHVVKNEIPLERAESFAELSKKLKERSAAMVVQVDAAHARALALLAASDKNLSYRKDARKAFEELIALVGVAAKSKSWLQEEYLYQTIRQIGAGYRKAGFGRRAAQDAVLTALKENEASPYFLKTVQGKFAVDIGWDARGTGTAGSVSEENAATFKAQLKEADGLFKAAFADKADRAEAPSEMIMVSIGLRYNRKVMEDWFARAMKADPDNYIACTRKLTYLEPKWHGTPPDCYAFGRQCMRSMNYHGGLPFILARAHAVTGAGGLHSHVAQHEIAWADVREVYEHQLQASPDDTVSRGEFAKLCVAVKQWKPAQNHLKLIRESIPLAVFPAGKKDYDAYVKRVNDEVAAQKK